MAIQNCEVNYPRRRRDCDLENCKDNTVEFKGWHKNEPGFLYQGEVNRAGQKHGQGIHIKSEDKSSYVEIGYFLYGVPAGTIMRVYADREDQMDYVQAKKYEWDGHVKKAQGATPAL